MRTRPVHSLGVGAVLAILAGATLIPGCTGELSQPAGPRTTPPVDSDGDGVPDDPGTPPTCTGDTLSVGSAPMRRLSNAEYERTLRDLFPGVTITMPDLPPDTAVSGFENDAASLGPSDLRAARWEDIAFRYGEAVTATPAALAAFLPCAASATDDASRHACGETLVREFGLRAMRRPLTADEATRYLALFDAQRAEIDFQAAVQLTVMALLQSPQFLYRVEEPAPGETPGTIVALGPYEIASRLSYFLWGTMPDDALFEAAAAGALSSDAEIEEQARRMLADARARDQVVDFHRQWLDFDRILMDEHSRRIDAYVWNEAVRSAVREEEDRFVERTIFEGEGTLRALLLSRETEVNASLASLYGVEGPADDATWAPVTLPEGERAGLLTRAGFLASHAHSGNGSPPLRGLYVTERILCEPRPSPPPGANLAPPMAEPGEGPRTNRDLFAERTASPVCQGCHMRIDGFGFGFENYDAIGAYRTTEQGLPVDASGNVIGTDVDGPYVGAIELSEALAESEIAHDCAARQWTRYALGRAPEPADACLVERLQTAFGESGGDVRELLIDLATSPELRSRPAMVAE